VELSVSRISIFFPIILSLLGHVGPHRLPFENASSSSVSYPMPTNNRMKRRAINPHDSSFSSSNHSLDCRITGFRHDRHGSQMPVVTADSVSRRIHDYRPPAQFHLLLDIEQENNMRMFRNRNIVGNFVSHHLSFRAHCYLLIHDNERLPPSC
jgi:hypothetical protein